MKLAIKALLEVSSWTMAMKFFGIQFWFHILTLAGCAEWGKEPGDLCDERGAENEDDGPA